MTVPLALDDYPRTEKVWGEERLIVSTPLYTLKALVISPGMQSSRHFHGWKTETFTVISGEVIVEVEGSRKLLSVGEQQHVRPHEVHQFSSRLGAILLEVSTQHDDHDVYRLGLSGPMEQS